MRITQLVVKNPSELDFTLPLLWRLRTAFPEVEVEVVYAASSRRQIVRDASVYSDVLEAIGARELDLADTLPAGLRPFRRPWRTLFARSYSDEFSIRDNLAAVRAVGLADPAGRQAATRAIRGAGDRARRAAERRLLEVADLTRGLGPGVPDVVLLGNRSMTPFPRRARVFDWLREQVPRVVLVPHAAHETVLHEFTPFDEVGPALPANADYWLVLEHTRTQELFEGRESQFAVVGNPSFDPAWVAWFGDFVRTRSSDAGDAVRCVVLGRKFAAPNARPSDDPFTLTANEMRRYIRTVGDAIRAAGVPAVVTFKPHPSTNLRLLAEMFDDVGCRWRVSNEPVAALIAGSDAAVGMFSTALALAAPFGVPAVVVPSRIQRYVEGRWAVMGDLYGGLRHYVREDDDLDDVVHQALAAGAAGATAAAADLRHLRAFIPDGAMERCLYRIIA